ncbi:alpha/beta fold hydrolase [Williamsia serinedens]|uniref:alpha/beta fold hydrolase n=1 Tax=Williamsia serinedens TaxID=391736 RepID=UPI0020A4C87A|nr:alpha/beta fold hydrolase [Williamsia serinedens]
MTRTMAAVRAMAPMVSDLRSVSTMVAPVRGVPQLAEPDLPWTEVADVDLGTRGRLRVRHTPGLHEAGVPPVVLLHGVTLTADLNFFALADVVGARRPAIVFDLPNHGAGIRVRRFAFTDLADDVVAVLDRLGVPRAVLLGYSLGGITAMVTADRHPSRVAGIVVQAAAMRYGDGDRASAAGDGVRGRRAHRPPAPAPAGAECRDADAVGSGVSAAPATRGRRAARSASRRDRGRPRPARRRPRALCPSHGARTRPAGRADGRPTRPARRAGPDPGVTL